MAFQPSVECTFGKGLLEYNGWSRQPTVLGLMNVATPGLALKTADLEGLLTGGSEVALRNVNSDCSYAADASLAPSWVLIPSHQVPPWPGPARSPRWLAQDTHAAMHTLRDEAERGSLAARPGPGPPDATYAAA